MKGEGGGKGPAAPAVPAVSILRSTVPKVGPGSVALAATAEEVPLENCRSWLLDTGCKYDLITRSAVPQRLHDSISRLLCLSPSLPPTTWSMVIW